MKSIWHKLLFVSSFNTAKYHFNASHCGYVCLGHLKIYSIFQFLQVVGEPRPDNPSKTFTDIAKQHNWCRTEYLGNFTGSRGYYFLGELVELEQAIIQLVVQKLRSHNFKLVTVPDILPAEAIENCGMPTRGERAQVKISIVFLRNHFFNNFELGL